MPPDAPSHSVSRLAGSPNLIFRERQLGAMRQMNDWSRLAVGNRSIQKLRTGSDCNNNSWRLSDTGDRQGAVLSMRGFSPAGLIVPSGEDNSVCP